MNAGPRTETVRSSEDERKSWGETHKGEPPGTGRRNARTPGGKEKS